MRNVVIVSPDPSNRAGGVERVCTLLAGVLERQGWHVNIVGPASQPSRWQFRLGLGFPSLSWSSTELLRTQKQPDLIITNGFLGLGCPRRVPRVHLYHGTMIGGTKAQANSLPGRERVRRALSGGITEALAGRAVTRLVCVSEAVADEVHRYYRLRCDAVIPNGIDTDIFGPREMESARERMKLPKDGRYALFVGRLEHGKGNDLLVEATRRAGYELLVAGSSGAPGTRHLGVLAPDALADAYAASDCVLFPSRYEACSLVVLEALACGRPLLTTRVGWMKTFLRAVPQYETLCVEPSVEDISTRLRSLESVNSAPLVADARAYVLEHNRLERWSARWKELLEEFEPSPSGARASGDTPLPHL
jgi:glycosyltransferase involved in cell wall biosynthesis